jgi:hypothetical protein
MRRNQPIGMRHRPLHEPKGDGFDAAFPYQTDFYNLRHSFFALILSLTC